SWSPNGKYIYFASNRTTPSYPFGMQDASIYRLALDWYAEDFNKLGFDKLFEEKEEKKDEKKKGNKKEETKKPKPVVKVNLEKLRDRVERVSNRFGTQNNPQVFTDGDKTIVFYNSNEDGGSYNLFKKVYKPFE